MTCQIPTGSKAYEFASLIYDYACHGLYNRASASIAAMLDWMTEQGFDIPNGVVIAGQKVENLANTSILFGPRVLLTRADNGFTLTIR